jgi:hypothetical protein
VQALVSLFDLKNKKNKKPDNPTDPDANFQRGIKKAVKHHITIVAHALEASLVPTTVPYERRRSSLGVSIK